MSFESDLNRIAAKIEHQSNRRVLRVAMAAFQEINRASPVDKGTFRANWVAAIDTLDRSFDLSRNREDFVDTTSVGMAVITNGAKLGTTVYICNSVPYAIRLEDGYSPQKPHGVVAPAKKIIEDAMASGRL